MIITISGTAGSGKSTVAKLIAKKLGYSHYSMGDLQRLYAKEKGITIVELGELEARDPTIDQQVDARQTQLAKDEDNFIIDSRLGFHFIPKSVKIFITVNEEVGARRILQDKRETEREKSISEIIAVSQQRAETNRKRFRKYYHIDYFDRTNYDLVIDSTDLTVEQVAQKILDFVQKTYKQPDTN